MDGIYAIDVAAWDDFYGVSYHRLTDKVQKVQKIDFVSATVNGLSCDISKYTTESQLIECVKELVDGNVENPTGDYLADYTHYIMPGEDNVGKPIGIIFMMFNREQAEQTATEFVDSYGQKCPVYDFIITIKVTMMDGNVGNFEHRFKFAPALGQGGYF